jgi:hypothetical protein
VEAVTHVYEELFGDYYSKSFKTLRGATSHAAKRLPEARYGYLAADEYSSHERWPKHIVAKWKRAGAVIAHVWK